MAAPQNFVTVSRRPPDVEDYIDMLRRYRAWLIGPMFAGLVIAVVVGFLWPNTYESSAYMRITPPQISERIAPTVINMQMQQRLYQMQQQILSRSALTELIQRPALNLYPKERAKMPIDDVIAEMKNPAKGIKIQMVDVTTPGGQGRTTTAFTIAFRYPDRFKAQATVQQLVAMFMEQNGTLQRKTADVASRFIDDEMKGAKEKMDGLEAQIAKFKAQNMGKLPEQFQSNVAQLNSLQMQLGNANEALSRLQQQKMQIETQLQTSTTQMNYYQSMVEDQVQVGGAGGQVVRNNKLDQLNQRIMDLQAGLAAAREMYTPTHPQVKILEARLKSMQKEFETEQKKDLDQKAAAATASTPEAQTRANPAAVKMVQDYQGAIANLKTEIQTTNLQMEDKYKDVQKLNAMIANLNGRIEGSPQLEQQYAGLMRDYALAKQAYEDTSRKQDLTDTAKTLEDRKAGETLEVLDPASDPIAPIEPNRLQIAGIGTGIGLMIGIVLAGAKEMKNTSLKNLKDVRAYTNLPVLSSIPLLENALLIRRKRRLQWLAWSAAVVVAAVATSWSAYYYYFGQNT